MGKKTLIRSNINVLLIFTFLAFSSTLNAQSDKKFIRKGNREYGKNNFSDSEILYRKAIDKNNQSADALFNIGDALYKQNKFEDAGKQFIENVSLNDDINKKSAGLFNLGNSLLKANKIQESIEAYKGSLKLRPDNNEAKYNLAYAQDLLLQQQQQDKQKDQNKDKDKDKDNKEGQNSKDKDHQKEQKEQKENKEQKQQEHEISKEDAQRLLNALANDEKNVQEKVKLAKAAKTKVKTVKNW